MIDRRLFLNQLGVSIVSLCGLENIVVGSECLDDKLNCRMPEGFVYNGVVFEPKNIVRISVTSKLVYQKTGLKYKESVVDILAIWDGGNVEMLRELLLRPRRVLSFSNQNCRIVYCESGGDFRGGPLPQYCTFTKMLSNKSRYFVKYKVVTYS